jgi:hypothetical protein
MVGVDARRKVGQVTKDSSWTRATTVSGTLADRLGLEKWSQRNVALGIAARPDLYAQAASCTPDDKDELNRIVEQAMEAAKASSGANLGTALHRFTQRIDQGEEVMVPAQWQPDVNAYVDAIGSHRVNVHPEWIERVVIAPQIGVAGTLDRLVTLPGRRLPMIADLKTGQDVVKYSMGEIATQLAIYAGATHAWRGSSDDIKRDRWGRYLLPDPNVEPDAYDPMPEVDREEALVIHLPVGQARCDLHIVDIASGRLAVSKAVWVRDWRKRKDLSRPYTSEEVRKAG